MRINACMTALAIACASLIGCTDNSWEKGLPVPGSSMQSKAGSTSTDGGCSVSVPCPGSNACTGVGQCVNGACTDLAAVDCDDSNPLTIDSCDPSEAAPTNFVNPNMVGPNPTASVCSHKPCQHQVLLGSFDGGSDGGSGTVCDDVCDSDSDCAQDPTHLCPGPATCDLTTRRCVNVSPIACNDPLLSQCYEVGSSDPAFACQGKACTTATVIADCNDGLYCNGQEVCNTLSRCAYGPSLELACEAQGDVCCEKAQSSLTSQACIAPDAGSSSGDGGAMPSDGGNMTVDAGPVDAGPVDAGSPVDAGPVDAGPVDAGPVDAGSPVDAGPVDAGMMACNPVFDSTKPVQAVDMDCNGTLETLCVAATQFMISGLPTNMFQSLPAYILGSNNFSYPDTQADPTATLAGFPEITPANGYFCQSFTGKLVGESDVNFVSSKLGDDVTAADTVPFTQVASNSGDHGEWLSMTFCISGNPWCKGTLNGSVVDFNLAPVWDGMNLTAGGNTCVSVATCP